MENNYLNFKKKNDEETELYIYGNIEKKDWIDEWLGTGKEKTDAYTLKDALLHVDTPKLTVRINSHGGDVSEALAIYSLLSDFQGELKTIVDGFACSAASVIFMAGKERIVPENGLLMIHNVWTKVRGDSNKMREVAEDLEKITQPSLNIYTNKTKLTEEEIKEKMDREEWITSDEAFEWGFSTAKEKKNNYMQAVDADFVYDLVIKNKELQKQIDKLKQDETDSELDKTDNLKFAEKTEKKIKEAIEQIVVDLEKAILKGSSNIEATGLLSTKTKSEKNDSWESFFNAKI